MSLAPCSVTLYYEGGTHTFTKLRKDLSCRVADLELRFGSPDDAPYMRVAVTGKEVGLYAISIKWQHAFEASSQFCGDGWGELSGSAQWRKLDPIRIFPWYVLIANRDGTNALGVTTATNAFAQWRINGVEVELVLDIRNGESGVVLNGRNLEVATVISRRYELTPFAACRAFCNELSPEPILPSLPIYGCMFSERYGRGGREAVLRESDELSGLSSVLTNRPYEIIDRGWQADMPQSASDIWRRENDRFKDMARLAEQLCNKGIRPGITLQLLAKTDKNAEDGWCSANGREALDPTVPEVLEKIQGDIRCMADWGYQLVRHVASTSDILGQNWKCFDPGRSECCRGGWKFYNHSLSNAEVIRSFYHVIRKSMGDMVVMGNDIIGHIGAGMMHCARIAAPLEGYDIQRYKHNCINALAFRNCQNNTFFSICPGLLTLHSQQEWSQVREFAYLQSHCGAAFLTSFPLASLTTKKSRAELSECFESASMGDLAARPLDWMNNTCPEEWEINGVTKHYNWYKYL